MQTAVNQMALNAAADEQIRENLICRQEQTILRTAASICRHYVSKSDDEWSIALFAFSKAVDAYEAGKGDFLPFAQMLIKRSLIDYYRSGRNMLQELSVAPHILEGNGEPGEDPDGVYLVVAKSSVAKGDLSLKEEIEAANEMLATYGFRFFDLTTCSPQQEKTRQECAVVIRKILADPHFLSELKEKKKLPVKALSAATSVSRKTLDRYRKYIIMAVLVLDGEYPQLAEYLKYVKETVTR